MLNVALLDKTAASKTLLEAVATPYPSADPANPHPISLPHTSRLYKTLLQGGPFSHATNAIVRSSLFSPADFARLFVEVVGKDHTLEMAKDDGAFVVAVLCERAAENDDLKKTMKSWFSSSVVKELETEKDKRGRKVLLEQIMVLS